MITVSKEAPPPGGRVECVWTGPESLRSFTVVLLFAAAAAAVWPLAGSVVPWDSKNHF
jgi:hypothetical protein